MSALQKHSVAKSKTCWIDLLFIAKVFVFNYANYLSYYTAFDTNN